MNNNFILFNKFPTVFTLGRNSFLISIDDTNYKFKNNSEIYIDAKDSNGENINVELLNKIEGNYRRIIIIINQNNNNGTGSITFTCEKLTHTVNINIDKYSNNESDLLFETIPNINISETNKQYHDFINITSASFDVIDNSANIYITKKYTNHYNVDSKEDISNNDYLLNEKYEYIQILEDNTASFKDEIINRNISIEDENGITYNTKIINVINKNKIELDPFVTTTEDELIINNVNYSINFYNKSLIENTKNYISYINVDIENLKLISGKLDKIKIFARPSGVDKDTNYLFISEEKIENKNLFIDTNSVDYPANYYKSVGYFNDIHVLEDYWNIDSGSDHWDYNFINQSDYLNNTLHAFCTTIPLYLTSKGIEITSNKMATEDNIWNITLEKDLNYEISFNYYLEKSNELQDNIKVYLVEVNPTTNEEIEQILIKNITQEQLLNKEISNVSINYKINKTANYALKLNLLCENIYINDINIRHDMNLNNTPNKYRFKTIWPLYIKRDTHFDILIEYYNEANKKSDIVSYINDIYIKGPNMYLGDIDTDAIGGWKITEDGFETFDTRSEDIPIIDLNSVEPELRVDEFYLKTNVFIEELSPEEQHLYSGIYFKNSITNHNYILNSIKYNPVSENFDSSSNRMKLYLGFHENAIGYDSQSYLEISETTGLNIAGETAKFNQLFLQNNTLFYSGNYIDISDYTGAEDYSWVISHDNAPSLTIEEEPYTPSTNPNYFIIEGLTRDLYGHLTSYQYRNLHDDLFTKLITSSFQFPDWNGEPPIEDSFILWNSTEEYFESYSFDILFSNINIFDNIDNTTPSANDVLIYNGVNSFEIRNLILSDNYDVTLSSPNNKDLLFYDSGEWKNVNFSTYSLNDLGNVNESGKTTNDVLQYNGTQWVPAGMAEVLDFNLQEINNVNVDNSFSGISNNNILYWDGDSFEFSSIATVLNNISPANINEVLYYNGTNYVPSSMGDLIDDIYSPSTNNIAYWNGSNLSFKDASAFSNIPQNLQDLNDVSSFNLGVGKVLTYVNSSLYRFQTILDSLEDSYGWSSNTNDMIYWNGSDFVINQISIEQLSDVDNISTFNDNDVMVWNSSNNKFEAQSIGGLSINYLREIGNVENEISPDNKSILMFDDSTDEYIHVDITSQYNFNDFQNINVNTPNNYDIMLYHPSYGEWRDYSIDYLLKVYYNDDDKQILGTNGAGTIDFYSIGEFLSNSLQLNDINYSTSTISDGDILVWDSSTSKFINSSLGTLTVNNIHDIGNVSNDPPSNNDLLIYNSGISKYENINLYDSILSSIGNFNNVDISGGLSLNGILVWDGSNFIPEKITDIFSTGSISIYDDINLTGISDNYILVYNSTSGKFEVENQANIGLSDKSITALMDVDLSPSTNELMMWDGDSFAYIDSNSLLESANLRNLNDVNITNSNINTLLLWNGTNYEHIDSSSLIISNLEDISNVENSPSNNQLLIYNGSSFEYINSDSLNVGTTINSLLDIADVENYPSDGNILEYDSSTFTFKWVVPAGGSSLSSILNIPDVNTDEVTPENNHILQYNVDSSSFELVQLDLSDILSQSNSSTSPIDSESIFDSTNLKCYYPIDSESGEYYEDFSGNDNDAVITTVGSLNNNLYFLLSGASFDINKSLFDIDISNDFSIVTNIKLTTIINDIAIITTNDDTIEIGINSSGNIYGQIELSSGIKRIDSDISLSTSEWFAIGLVYDSSNCILKLYLNNLLIGYWEDNGLASYNLNSTSNNIIVEGGAGKCEFYLDNLYILNKPLVLHDIKKLSTNISDNLSNAYNFNNYRLINDRNNNTKQYLDMYYFEKGIPGSSNNIFVDEVNNYDGDSTLIDNVDDKYIDFVEWSYVIKNVSEIQKGKIRCNIANGFIEKEIEFEHKDTPVSEIENVAFDYKFDENNNSILLLIDNLSTNTFKIKVKTTLI